MVIGCTGHKVNADSNVVKEYSAGEVRTGPRHRKASYYEITATPETTETWMR